jgi:hypothetical protein
MRAMFRSGRNRRGLPSGPWYACTTPFSAEHNSRPCLADLHALEDGRTVLEAGRGRVEREWGVRLDLRGGPAGLGVESRDRHVVRHVLVQSSAIRAQRRRKEIKGRSRSGEITLPKIRSSDAGIGFSVAERVMVSFDACARLLGTEEERREGEEVRTHIKFSKPRCSHSRNGFRVDNDGDAHRVFLGEGRGQGEGRKDVGASESRRPAAGRRKDILHETGVTSR